MTRLLLLLAMMVPALWLAAPARSQQQQPAPEGVLTIGLPATNDLTLSAAGPAFARSVTIATDSFGASFRVEVTPLRDGYGNTAPVKAWFGSDTTRVEVSLGPLESTELNLRATLPAPGEYRGMFTLVRRRKREGHAFSVAWPRRPQSPLEVTGGGAIAIQLHPFTWFGRRSTASIPFTIHDTSAVRVAVRRPALASLRREHAADTAFAVHHGRVQFKSEDGAALNAGFNLDPHQSREVRLVVEEAIAEAGTYTASVRVAGPDYPAYTLPVKLYARHPWYLAAIVILVGVGIAETIRRYHGSIRPRLDRQRRASELLGGLGSLEKQLAAAGPGDPTEPAVLGRLRARLLELYEDPELGTRAEADADLAEAKARLRLAAEWAEASRRVAAVTVPDLHDDLRAHVDPARDYLMGEAADETARTAAGQKLRGLADAIADALKEHLKKEIAAFKSQVETERAAHPTDDAFLEAVAAEVEAALVSAADYADAGRLAQATADFEKARTRYVDLLAANLRMRLAQARPDWLTDDRWEEARTKVTAALDRVAAAASAGDRLRALDDAQALYLREMATTLQDAAKALLGQTPPLPAAERDSLEQAMKKSVEVLSRAAMPDLPGAAAAFASAETAWKEYGRLSAARGGQQADAAKRAPDAAAGALPAGVAAPLVTSAFSIPVLSPAALTERIGWLDKLVTVLAALLAVVAGVKLLWDPRLTWGTSTDLLTALVWGLGLQQLGNDAFRGIAPLFGRGRGTEESDG